ncbi:MAG: sulfotransferase family protein [Desulfoferrobacter sp.]
MAKIFGIGMPKTGTSSLHKALEILGFKSIHFASDEKTVQEIQHGQYRLSVLNEYDAISDIPTPAIFAQLDSCWPDSKFILTIRDLKTWLDSCRNAPFNSLSDLPEAGHFRHFYRTLLYGVVIYNEERFAWVYNTHLKIVKEHFSGSKESQLLILNICDGEGWDKLCPFLGVPKPDRPFPHANPRQTAEIDALASSRSHVKKLKTFAKRLWF